MPRPRIPVAKPSIRHSTKKDYKRDKRQPDIEHTNCDSCGETDINISHHRCWWDNEHRDMGGDMDLFFMLEKFGITSVPQGRRFSYG